MRRFGIVFTAVVFFSLLVSSQAHATPTPQLEWIRTYDSPAHDDDEGYGVTVDAAGNVYVTGQENRSDLGQSENVWLRKYDTNGNTLWARTYDSPSHTYDRGHGVAVDASGNVYVAGFSKRNDLGQDNNIWLRKYDTTGNTLWTRTYDSPSHDNDSGHDVVLDAAGNVYVIGYEERNDLGQDTNVWLRKYDTNGNTLWTQMYNSPSNSGDFGSSVAVDTTGNVYVTGYESRPDLGQGSNIWVRKYNANGNISWTDTYDGPGGTINSDVDSGRGIALDKWGYIYVAGYEMSQINSNCTNVWLRKYDTNGNTLWTQTYDSPNHSYDFGWDIAVDAAGNVYVTGEENRDDLGQSANIWLRKYDTDGNTLWTEAYDSPAHFWDGGYDVTVDSAGNVYVTGYEYRPDLGEYNNIILLKYSQIPEPGTLLLLAPVLAVLGGYTLKRKPRRSNETYTTRST